jgi:hypothetical protein
MRPTHVLAALVLATAVPLAAQEAKPAKADPDKAVQGTGALPEGWMARVDKDAPLTKVKFENMAPGWHVTLGPAAVFYRPTDNVAGDAHLVTLIHLFPGATHAEGYGLIIGGSDLQGEPGVHHFIREDGKYLIKRRKGRGRPWWMTANDARQMMGSQPTSCPSRSGDKVSSVNGKEVHYARSSVDSQGIAGLRINHLSVHVRSLRCGRVGGWAGRSGQLARRPADPLEFLPPPPTSSASCAIRISACRAPSVPASASTATASSRCGTEYPPRRSTDFFRSAMFTTAERASGESIRARALSISLHVFGSRSSSSAATSGIAKAPLPRRPIARARLPWSRAAWVRPWRNASTAALLG